MDVSGAEEKLNNLKLKLSQNAFNQNISVMGISAKHLIGINELLHELRVLYDSHIDNSLNL